MMTQGRFLRGHAREYCDAAEAGFGWRSKGLWIAASPYRAPRDDGGGWGEARTTPSIAPSYRCLSAARRWRALADAAALSAAAVSTILP